MSSENRTYTKRARAEREAETRQRIIEAVVALHKEVGPARTTVAEVARRAGVQRLTVYNHFPQERELFAACSAHFLSQHRPPDFTEVLALDDPVDRVRGVLRLLYPSFRERSPMTSKVLRDRTLVPELDALLSDTMDRGNAALRDGLTSAFKLKGKRADRVRALVGLAIDFWTWHRLDAGGLSDADAAELMAGVVGCAAED